MDGCTSRHPSLGVYAKNPSTNPESGVDLRFDTSIKNHTAAWSPCVKTKYNCPAEMTMSLIGGKWKVILIYNLRRGPKRFGELKRLSPGITAATLTQQLRELEELKLVSRATIGADRLAGVEYSLTEKGESLKPVLKALIRWGLDNQKDYALGDFVMVGRV